MASVKAALLRAAGLAGLSAPALEDVDRRRSQLWALSIVVGVAVPGIIVALGYDIINAALGDALDVRTVRLVLLALLVALFGYVAEREQALRRLTAVLVDERVLTAQLVATVDELGLLVDAGRELNASLQVDTVLDVILRSAATLLRAEEGSIRLRDPDDPEQLRVAAVHGEANARVGDRMRMDRDFDAQVAASRAAMLIGTGGDRRTGRAAALLVTLEHHGDLIGVLELRGRTGAPDFTAVQLRSVAVFAETAAAAIANARLHAEVHDQVAALTELDRMKDDFLAMVSHELRTPLTSLIGLAATLASERRDLPTREVRTLATTIRNEGWRLERLVRSVLQTAAAERGTLPIAPRSLDLAAHLRQLCLSLAEAVSDHDLRVETDPTTLECTVDPDAFSQIVTNLVDNAAKFSPASTRVEVRLRQYGDGVALSVSDRGPGVAPELREEIFDRFRRGVTSTTGLGLGLAIVRSLAEAHHGLARVEPGPGGGSVFTVTLADQSDLLAPTTSGILVAQRWS
ncbi:MAG: HAMP domain-containing histidine kinase [Euzebyales bacterium]|nr:HAMP domain-containing histidine kinase [Euzebyales bacterium]